MTIFFLYLSGAEKFRKKYVIKTVILVERKVITDNTKGNIEFSSHAQVLAALKVLHTSKNADIAKTKTTKRIDQDIQEISAHSETTHKSFSSIFCGQKLIFIFY